MMILSSQTLLQQLWMHAGLFLDASILVILDRSNCSHLYFYHLLVRHSIWFYYVEPSVRLFYVVSVSYINCVNVLFEWFD